MKNNIQYKTNKKNILMIVGSYWPDISGGGLQVRLLSRFLKKFYNFYFLTTTTNKSLKSSKKVFRIYYKNNLFYNLINIIELIFFFLINSHKFDIIYIRGFTKKIALVIILGKIFNKYLIYSPTRYQEDDLLTIKKKKPLIFFLFYLVDKFLNFDNCFFQFNYFNKKSVKINCYVDCNRFKPELKNSKIPTILAVGFFSKIKNTKLTYLVWRDLFLKGVKSNIVFAGKFYSDYYLHDNSIYDFIRKDSIKNSINKYIKILGEVEYMPELYKNSEIFVLPSEIGDGVNSMVEAMASKNAVIITNFKHINSEFIHGYHCYKIKKNSYSDFINYLEKLITKQDLRKILSENAYRYIKNEFDIRNNSVLSKLKNIFLQTSSY
jgi:glycosyltransferase involved in cell wall biosynthesis